MKSDSSVFGEYEGLKEDFKGSELGQFDGKNSEYQDEIEKIKLMFQ